MRLHVNCIYALMLILSYTLSVNITCDGKVEKRAIDFDEISDFADIIEPQQNLDIKNSITKVQNLEIDLPEDITNDWKNTEHQQIIENEVVTPQIWTLTNTEESLTTNPYSKKDVAKVLNFRMRQSSKRPYRDLRYLRKKRQVPLLFKRYINMPITASRVNSYLGHLADATNDIHLKMQNYAATMMVVLTTSKSTPTTAVMPRISGKLMEIKTLEPPEKRAQTIIPIKAGTETTNYKETKLDDSLLKTFPNLFSTSKSTSNLEFASTKPQRSVKQTTPIQAEATTGTTSKPFVSAASNQHNKAEDDYPLLGADGFYGSSLTEVKSKQSHVSKRDLETELNNNRLGLEMNSFDQLLKVVPMQVKENRQPEAEVSIKPSVKTVVTPAIVHITIEPRVNDKPTVSVSTNPTTPTQTTTSTTTTKKLLTTSLAKTTHRDITSAKVATVSRGIYDDIYKKTATTIKGKGNLMATTTPMATSRNPYRWENDIIKELNVKFKKEVLSSTVISIKRDSGDASTTALATDSTTVSQSESTASTSSETGGNTDTPASAASGSSESGETTVNGGASTVSGPSGNGSSPASEANTTVAGPSYEIPLQDGKTAKVSICKGKECQKLYDGFKVYNDTAGDCNKEANDVEGGPGDYNIINNEETPSTEYKQHAACPITVPTSTEPETSSQTKPSCKQQTNSCERADEEPDADPCDTNMSQGPESSKHSHKKDKKKNQNKKPSRPKGKRQVSNMGAPIYATVPNFMQSFSTPQPILYQPYQSSSFSPIPEVQQRSVYVSSPGTLISQVQLPIQNQAMLGMNPNYQSSPNPISYSLMPTQASILPVQIDRVFKKSIDKNTITSVIENLKVVDQKLAEAVDPLHSAQELLDTATRCDVFTQCSDQPNNQGGGGNGASGLLNELNENEKAALQRLAIKIMANQQPKLKRAEQNVSPQMTSSPQLPGTVPSADIMDSVIAKRGIEKATVQPLMDDYEYADQDRLSRLQRDLLVANELEAFVEHLNDNDRQKRTFLGHHIRKPSSRTHVISESSDQNYDEFGGHNFKNFLYEKDNSDHKSSLLPGSINTRIKNKAVSEEAYSKPPITKKKQKTIWRKLFGMTGTRNNKNRFLDQDFPNSQSHYKKINHQ